MKKILAAGLGIIAIIMKDSGQIPMLENPRETASHYAGYLKGENLALPRLYRTEGATEWTRSSPGNTDRF